MHKIKDIIKRASILFLTIIFAGTICACGISSNTEDKKDNDAKEQNSKTEEKQADAEAGDDLQEDDEQSETVTPIDYVVVLDPGHGGSFSGAASGSLVEKELTLAIGLKIREYINDNYPNVAVYMTRETDTELSTDVVEDIELRCEYAKSVDADILVSLHLNASEEHTSYGANMYISHMENVQEDSERLATCILSKITSLGIADYGIHTRNSSDHFDDSGNPLDYYAINRHCASRDIPGIIVEHCFIDNEGDQSYINSDEALERLAAADAEGILEYLFSEN